MTAVVKRFEKIISDIGGKKETAAVDLRLCYQATRHLLYFIVFAYLPVYS